MRQLNSGIHSTKMPMYDRMDIVSLIHNGSYLPFEDGFGGHVLLQPSTENTQLNFRHIQPTGVFGCEMKFQPSKNPTNLIGCERFTQSPVDSVLRNAHPITIMCMWTKVHGQRPAKEHHAAATVEVNKSAGLNDVGFRWPNL